jgi:elongation factor 2
MRFSVSAVVRVAVEVKNSADLPKLVEGLKRLQKSDPLVQSFTTKTGEHIVAGAGELHLEICLNDLQNDFMKGAPLKISDPVVSFSETLTKESELTCISKSANKHNRLFANAGPLGEEFCVAVDKGLIEIDTKDFKKRARYLVEEFNWDKNDALRVWSFGCAPDGKPNVLVDMTKGASFLAEIKDHVVGAFLQYSLGGVYCDEPLRGCRFNLLDITLHADAIHRGAGQISPASKKVFAACQMKSGPRLLEPLYLCDITVPNDKVSGVYTTLQSRRGRICPDAEDTSGGGLSKVKAFLPVLESFGFTQLLRQNTGGKAFPQMIFDHWELVEANKDDLDITNPATKTHQCVLEVRTRKGLKAEMPDWNEYHDKL